MVIDPISILTLVGITIILGYIGNFIFDKTRIPDIVWLLLLGLIVGPLFGLVERSIFVAVSGLLSAVALLIILFDAGLHMDFYQVIRNIPRGTLLALSGVIFSAFVVAGLSMILFNFNLMYGLILGFMISGTSSAIVISLVNKMTIKDNVKKILALESIITDPIIIVIVIILLQIVTLNAPSQSVANTLASAYSIAIVIGLVGGLVWIVLLDKLKGKGFDYMLTLSFLILLYVLVETLGGSGAIAALIFGLILGNSVAFSKMLKFKKAFTMDHMLEKFQSEITFFIRSFFFVYIGLVAVISSYYLIYGLIITAALIITRYFATKISVYKMKIEKTESKIIQCMVPRGLAAAVMAQLPLSYGLADGDVFLNIAFIVILATVLYTTFATRFFYKPKKKRERKPKEQTKIEEGEATEKISKKGKEGKASEVVLFQPH